MTKTEFSLAVFPLPQCGRGLVSPRGGRRRGLAADPRPRVEHGADDLVVAGAAAKIAGKPIAGLFLGRVLVLVEQRLRRDDKDGGAEAALQGGVLEEFLLHRMQLVALGDALDRGDRAAFGLDAEHQAGTDQLAVDDDATGATIAGAAAFLAAGQAELVAQAVEHGLLCLAQKLYRLAVDDSGYVVLAHGGSLSWTCRINRATRRGRRRWRRCGGQGRRRPWCGIRSCRACR